jgi:hypothetical protein
MPLSDETKKTVQSIFLGMETVLSNLWCRWQDEKEYEDWRDYAKAIDLQFTEVISKLGLIGKAKIVKATKRPMGFIFNLDGWEFHVKMTARNYDCSAKKI